MPINKTKRENGYGEKLQVKIVTVDKEKRRVECVTRDGAMIFVAVWETGTVFRWPAVGETWTVRKDTGIWRLDAIVTTKLGELESEHFPTPLSELPEGATRLVGEEVHMANANTQDITASGTVTAANQSLLSHVDLTPRTPLTISGGNSEEVWGEESFTVNFDGVAMLPGQRILLREQEAKYNGIYEVAEFNPTKYSFVNTAANFEQELTSNMKEATVAGHGWRTMPTIAAGSSSVLGWSPPSFETPGGQQWEKLIQPSNGGILTQLKVPAFSWPGTGRFIAIWSNMPEGVRTGYRATFICTATTNVWNIFVQKITAASVTAEVSALGYTAAAPFTLQMVSAPNGVSMYVNGTGLLFLNDQQYVENVGYSGVEGTGSNPVFSEFKTAPVLPGSGTPYKVDWKLKRTDDEERTGQKVVVESGETRKNTEFPITKSTETETEFEGWSTPTFSGSWESYENAGAYDMPRYRKLSNGMVVIKGLIKGGTFSNPTLIFTLPSGYRPSRNLLWPCWISYTTLTSPFTGAARLDVMGNGEVIIREASGLSVNFLSINTTFYADGN